jgi:hypothetical protein
MRTNEGCRSSYQVVVVGELGPAVLAFCARPPTHSETSRAFQVRLRDGQGIAEVAAMLQTAGLIIVSIRLVSQRETWAPASVSA